MLRFEKILPSELKELKRICNLKGCLKISYQYWIYNDRLKQEESEYTIWIADTKQHYYFETYWDVINFVERKRLLFRKF